MVHSKRSSSGRSRRRVRFPRWLMLALVLVLLIGSAPYLLMHSPLRQHVVALATRGLDGKVTVAHFAGGWFSPLLARDVVAVDAFGNTLIAVQEIHADSSLLGVLFRGLSNMNLTITEPRLFVVFEPESSNVEKAIAKWLVPSGSKSSVSCSISIHDGTAVVKDTVTGSEWSIEDIQAEFRAVQPAQSDFSSSMSLVSAAGNRSDLEVTYSLADQRHELQLVGGEISLSIADPLVRRVDPQLALQGSATGQASVDWSQQGGGARIDSFTIRDFSLATARWLPDERLQIPLLAVTGKAQATPAEWQVDNLQLDSQPLKLRVDGGGALVNDAQVPMLSRLLRGLLNGQLQLEGECDVAEVAKTIPKTVQLRAGRQITAGNVTFVLRSAAAEGGNQWNGQVTADRLAALDGNRVVTWDDPLQITVSANEQDGIWDFEELRCRGSFVEASARGSLREGRVSFVGDLGQFAADAGRFFDLSRADLAGQVNGSAGWKQGRDGGLHFTADTETTDFHLTLPAGAPWREAALRIHVSGDAVTDGRQIQRITAGAASLTSGSDHFKGSLTAPVTVTKNAPQVWPLQIQLQGELATWLPRLQYLLPSIATSWEGNADLEADIVYAGTLLEIRSAEAQFQELAGRVAGVDVRERQVELELVGDWDSDHQQGNARQVSCVSSAVSFRAEDVAVVLRPAFHLKGRIGYRADLQRVSSWFGSPTCRLSGELTGHAAFSDNGSSTVFQGDAEATSFVYESAPARSSRSGFTPATADAPWQPVWSEDRLTFAARATIDRDAGEAQLDSIEVSSTAISLGATGDVHDFSGRCELVLDGQVSYDLQQLTDRLSPRAGADIELSGTSTQPFAFRGPLRATPRYTAGDPQRRLGKSGESQWTQFTASSKVDWESAAILGVAIGAGAVDARLLDGMLTFEPVDVQVSGGRVTVRPTLDMRSDPILLTIPAGTIAERVAISRKMCHTWLKYVAPLVADATAVEGSLSVAVEESTVPLGSIAGGKLRGNLHVHSARVGPGDLTREFLAIAESLRSFLRKQDPRRISPQWIQLPEQHIAFHVENNRVHHQGLHFVVDDVRVTTSGSVGLDQTMTVLATAAIPDDWVANDRWLSALRGQKLQIPIHGTLSSPRLDSRAVDQLAKQMVGGAATRLLEQELGRGLDRLFGPRQ